MLKGIPIGIEDFKKIRETDCYYIDKTKFIEDILIDRTVLNFFVVQEELEKERYIILGVF